MNYTEYVRREAEKKYGEQPKEEFFGHDSSEYDAFLAGAASVERIKWLEGYHQAMLDARAYQVDVDKKTLAAIYVPPSVIDERIFQAIMKAGSELVLLLGGGK